MKTCTSCSKPKDIEQFRNTHLSPDGRANICKDCATKRRLEKKAAPEAPEVPEGPSMTRGASLGYTATIQENDVILEQKANKLQTVWLSFDELESLYAWYESQRSAKINKALGTATA